MAGSWRGRRDATPSRPPKPVGQGAALTVPGSAGRQSYGTGRDRAWRKYSAILQGSKSLVFRLACGLREKQKASPGVFARGDRLGTALTPSQRCHSAEPQPFWIPPPARIEVWHNQSPALPLQEGGGKGTSFSLTFDGAPLSSSQRVPPVRGNWESQRFGRRPLDRPIADGIYFQRRLVVNKTLP